MILEKVYDELISMIEDLRSGQRQAEYAIADLKNQTRGAQPVTGNPISINDAAPINAETLTVTLEPIQSGTGDPTPENVRPITGYSALSVNSAGVNVWDEVWELGTIDSETGENVPSPYMFRSKNYIPCLPNTAYYIKATNIARVFYYDINKGVISYVVNPKNITITTPSNCHYMRFRTLDNNTTYNNDISFNYPSTDTQHHAYQANTASISFGQTVYGGSVNFKTGLVTITDANIASYDGETLPGEWISSMDVYDPDATPTTGAQVVYKLAEATTLQLSPAELTLLKGLNNISVDGNATIDMTYQPDNVLGQILAISEADDVATLNAAKAYADSVVTITPALESGTKLADYTISGTAGVIYGPGEQQATRKTTTKKTTKEE